MPVPATYPGVYIDEVASSVHTIVGVPTSVAAFVGAASRGPTDTPVHVTSWADVVRTFGALDLASPLSVAVYLFFLNGGMTAEVVRLGVTGGVGSATTFTLSEHLTLEASSPGAWGDALTISTDSDGLVHPDVSFNLTITDTANHTVERYTGLTLTPGPQNVQAKLQGSRLVRVTSTSVPAPAAPPVPPAGPPPVMPPVIAAVPPAAPAADDGPPPAEGAPGAVAAVPAGQPGANATVVFPGDPLAKTGIYALDGVDIFNMLCLPTKPGAGHDNAQLTAAAKYCTDRRAMLIVDPPAAWTSSDRLTFQTVVGDSRLDVGSNQANAAVYYPNLRVSDPSTGTTVDVGPSAAVAGVWAATDNARGVWKAPAGTAAVLSGVTGFSAAVDDGESGVLNPLGVNALRTLPIAGSVIWGARTAAGADEAASQWKYLPVRRTALFIEESLRRGTQWVVFEPNDEPLWSAIRLNVGAFMNSLFRQGAFQGSTPREAYLVKCDADNNPQNDIDRGIVNITVGFAPLKPAEFVFIHLEQLAGQLQT